MPEIKKMGRPKLSDTPLIVVIFNLYFVSWSLYTAFGNSCILYSEAIERPYAPADLMVNKSPRLLLRRLIFSSKTSVDSQAVPTTVYFLKLSSCEVKDAVAAVSIQEVTVYNEGAEKSVAFVDYGAKESAVQFWVNQGLKVVRVPAFYSAAEILALNTDGIVLSEGPGNPMENTGLIATIKELIDKKPMFAVGLGMQMTALAFGAQVAKMKHGHRGANQPVKYLGTGRVYVSSQNHGYEVVKESVKTGEIRFINVNDGGVEGIEYVKEGIVSVQFSPESCSAALEPNFLAQSFIAKLSEVR